LLAGGCPIEVDGGIDVGTAFGCVRRGASVLVAGSAIFARDSPGEAFRSLVRSAAA
jgi:pentose-5-phosphate-3-epimerase